MRLVELSLRGLALAMLVLVATVTLIVGQALLRPLLASPTGQADAIVVLGAGTRPNGAPERVSKNRVREGLELFNQGLAPHLHFTGGHGNPDVMGLGEGMAEYAISLGAPADAVSHESASRSTLQNALFSVRILPPEDFPRIILVTDGYHLPRAWASLRWAGYRHVALADASAFGGGAYYYRLRRIARESLAWWYNLARVGLYEILNRIGVDEDITIPLLASSSRPQVA